MPIRDNDESEEPQADSGLLEFIDQRRDYQARERRRRLMVAAIAALGVITIALAFSNAILMRRLAARTESPPAASVPTPAAAAAPTASVATPRVTSAPDIAPAVASAPTTRPAKPATAPPSANAAMVLESTMPPAARTLPTSSSAGASDSDSARRTARWLVQTHGRLEAESRVTKVAEFYSGEQGTFWRRVLLNVRQEPER